jgi:REP element-mobilizing transposase RayT
MPRPLRTHFPDAIFHVTNRGVDRQPIFLSDKERLRFMTELSSALSLHGALLLAYCLMPNHLHLFIQAGAKAISAPLQRAFGAYSSYYNLIHGRTGHLFQGRHHQVLCTSEKQLVDTVTYILMNPVDAGLVKHPGEWAWSSHWELVRSETNWTDLSRLEEASGMTSTELKELYLARLERSEDDSVSEPMEILVAGSAARFGVSVEDLRSGRRSGAHTNARMDLLKAAQAAGFKDVEIARALGCTKGAVSLLRRKV